MPRDPHFLFEPNESTTEIRLFVQGAPIAPSSWPLSTRHKGADLCQVWLASGEAIEVGDAILVENATIARLSSGEAAALDLPPLTSLRAVIRSSGIMLKPGFRVSLQWTNTLGQSALGIERVGAWLREHNGWRRLSEPVFHVGEAVESHARAAASGDETARQRAVLTLAENLPAAARTGGAESIGLLETITLIEADALTLEIEGEGDAMRIVPLLRRAGAPLEGALLPDHVQRALGRDQFFRWRDARPVYALGHGVFVLVAPALRVALERVRRVADAPASERRAFAASPGAAFSEALEGEGTPELADHVYIESETWSERVAGLGLWQKRVLPWMEVETTGWFEPSGVRNEPPRNPPTPPTARGLQVGDAQITLTPQEARKVQAEVRAAMQAGRPSVTIETAAGPIELPATEATLHALVPLIKPNESAIEYEALIKQRAGVPRHLPSVLHTVPKPHQREGIVWLQASWAAGSPGVLLADEMGLGKSLQGLAFLAWLREAMTAGQVAKAPLLVVAPTGLLENWRREHNTHLASPGLGKPLLAYGPSLAALRQSGPDGALVLDRARIAAADWVLTTYHTLRDHLLDFGAIRFSCLLMDEAQLVKTPGTRLTDASKAIHADFRIAMTGTPVENRLADLWCIIDNVAPGHLHDLAWFSREFEADPNADSMQRLKESFEHPVGGRPPLLLRRLAKDRLPDLPERTIHIEQEPIAGAQLRAYREVQQAVRAERNALPVLAALGRLREVSLGVDLDSNDDEAVIAGSARLRAALRCLENARAREERALVFVDRLETIGRLAALFQRRFSLSRTPAVITGEVAGPARQARVDRFQQCRNFDLLLMTPRAGGVGLTVTNANHVVHLSRWWNPAVEDQATARVLRIGQTRHVYVTIPLAVLLGESASFDINLNALLERKRRLTQAALMPSEASGLELADLLDQSLA